MLKKRALKRYTRQVLAIVEKNIFLELHVKGNLVSRFLNPIIQLIVLVFIFGAIFNINQNFTIGYWNATNYVLFLLIAFSIQFTKSITSKYYTLFIQEKYWKTLSAIMIAPVNRFVLLIGILISELLMNSLPFLLLIITALILFPIPLYYLILVMLVYFSIFIVFASIGLILGALSISKEGIFQYFSLILRFIFLFSCINYPKEIFPEIIQFFIITNPLYYFFDFLRLIWLLGMGDQSIYSLITLNHLIIVISLTIITPLFSVLFFERIYKKYGITGY
ncbi:MAG: ABC transporter permease [Promethearchaeota archaeon]